MKQIRLSSQVAARALLAAFAGVLSVLAPAAWSAQTDISASPIISTGATQVKPNIMVLMDTSDSMRRSHMPDEVETVTGILSVGYKNSSCNALYYNPATTYLRPRDAAGNYFPVPSFTAAPYAGFAAYYPSPDATELSSVNLSTSYVPYDGKTLRMPPIPGVTAAVPGPAYYYRYNGTATLDYRSAPCTDIDTGASTGDWQKVVITAGSPEATNFAIWYSYYRTRISLIKSTTSLAFAPVSDSTRVGFITVSPITLPAWPAVPSTQPTVDPARFLALKDFDSTQRSAWFSKLFSQIPAGTSPAREGLARVGRYYGGQEDSINRGMPATGVNDPIQYACQQNFTIMTTDGYWNGQGETPTTSGIFGGPLALNGTDRVGQRDGDPGCAATDPFCARPIWDGSSTETRVVTRLTDNYQSSPCGIGSFLKSTAQTTKGTTVATKSTSTTTRRERKYGETSAQQTLQTTQTVRTVRNKQRTTRQYWVSTGAFDIERYQHKMSKTKTTRTAEQYQLQTRQVLARTSVTTKQVFSTLRRQEQWTTAIQNYVLTSTQWTRKTEQLRESREQWVKYAYRVDATVAGSEDWHPLDGPCVVGAMSRYGLITGCQTTVVTPNTYVLRANCTPGVDPATSVQTTCTNVGYIAERPVAACSAGLGTTTGPNAVVTTCTRVVTEPEAGVNGTCTAPAPTSPDYYIVTCSQPSATNFSNSVNPPCTPGTTSSGAPNYITRTCTNLSQAATASPPCTVGSTTVNNVVTTCAKPIDNSVIATSVCTPSDGTTSPYMKVTCTPQPAVTTTVVNPANCSAGVVNGVTTTCTETAVNPYPTATPVKWGTCTSGPGANYYTTCTTPAGANNQTVFVSAATCGSTTGTTNGTNGNGWVDRICSKPAGANNGQTFVDPTTCVADPGTSSPFLKVTCSTVVTMQPTIVAPGLCPSFGSTFDPVSGEVTICTKGPVLPRTRSSTPCTPGTTTSGNTVTVCYDVSSQGPVNPNALPSACSPANIGRVINSGAPNYESVLCTQPAGANNATTWDAACVPNDGSAFPHIAVTCTPVVVSGPTVVDGRTCVNGSTTGPNNDQVECVTSAAGPTPVAQPAQTCTAGFNGTYNTVCDRPAATNYVDKLVGPCSAVAALPSAPNWITKSCRQLSDSGELPWDTASCQADAANSSPNGWYTCTTTPYQTDVPTATCVVGTSSPNPPYEIITSCKPGQAPTMAPATSCTPGNSGAPNYVETVCGSTPLTSGVIDPACTPGTDASGVITTCTPTSTAGFTYTVSRTTRTVTTAYTGTTAGGSVTNTVTGPTTPVNAGACYATAQTFSQPTNPPDVVLPGAPGSYDSLADVAQYYYRQDLRPTMEDRVLNNGGGNVEDDNAKHQHMTTFVVGLGVSGTLEYQQNYRSTSLLSGDFADIRTGVKTWPVWPQPSTAMNYTQGQNCPLSGFPSRDCTENYNDPRSIDDFWHAAVNGRGTYFSAKDPTTVIQGLNSALANITAEVAAGAGDAASTLEPIDGNNQIFSPSYKTGQWVGDIQSFALDVSSTDPNVALTPGGSQLWSAQARLQAKRSASCDDRNIYLMRASESNPASRLVPFVWDTVRCSNVAAGPQAGTLTAAEKGFFGATQANALSQYVDMADGTGGTQPQRQAITGPSFVNFLRGQSANEGYVYNNPSKLFRSREAVLGDIVGSQPVFVKAPFAAYLDAGYAAFASAKAGRAPMIYVGANDGMLHAFHAEDGSSTVAGDEAWAMIPSAVLPNLYKLADNGYSKTHQFFVDGSPVVADIADSGVAGGWRTILVGGLNAGGKGYYALDVTNPTAPVGLWEFKLGACSGPGSKEDCNLGLSFGKPVITKVPVSGVERWVVMVTSGYNNVSPSPASGDGGGYLYVLNAVTGELIYKLATGVGDSATPSGLAQINNYVDNVLVNNTTVRAYGGDLLGNVWRFEFPASGSPAVQLVGTAKTATGVPQPITTRPELAELDGKPMVFVGTGRFLGASDVSNSQVQSIYGISDTLATPAPSPVYADLRTELKPLGVTQVGTGATAVRTIACTSNVAADCTRAAGWVVDLPESGERINVDMKLVLGTLTAASNVPQDQPCDVGGHSWFNYIDFRTGLAVNSAAPSDSNNPASSRIISQYAGDWLVAGFNILKGPTSPSGGNSRYTGQLHGSNTEHRNIDVPVGDPHPAGRRISWREIRR
ncbi:PilC/PilY family type IV pilus protein [Piscinibacter koreensis]|uniref:PilY1 beta-propeller domain-containing protein n=1 Tax=Piscinibacter koreensis TaxID=2742824 RepID=A0A7Y6NM18_9BURK|nr:PilC/PilY family type IV pilus protein [Schlegelella koreensis]NUZ05650.1 hypothetical protein [Schlegelella koreensis]